MKFRNLFIWISVLLLCACTESTVKGKVATGKLGGGGDSEGILGGRQFALLTHPDYVNKVRKRLIVPTGSQATSPYELLSYSQAGVVVSRESVPRSDISPSGTFGGVETVTQNSTRLLFTVTTAMSADGLPVVAESCQTISIPEITLAIVHDFPTGASTVVGNQAGYVPFDYGPVLALDYNIGGGFNHRYKFDGACQTGELAEIEMSGNGGSCHVRNLVFLQSQAGCHYFTGNEGTHYFNFIPPFP